MRKISIYLIRFYQILSPIHHQIMLSVFGYSSVCHQKPSCSEYTILQIQKHGTITGLKKGFWRVIHCSSLQK